MSRLTLPAFTATIHGALYSGASLIISEELSSLVKLVKRPAELM